MAVSNNLDSIKKLVMALANNEELYVAVQNLAIGAGIGMLSVGAGIWLGGIPGILAGAAVGGVSLAYLNGGVKPLSDYLEKLSPEMQEKLYNGIKNLLKGLIWFGFEILLEKVLEDTNLKNNIVFYIKSFFEGTLKIKVVQKKNK